MRTLLEMILIIDSIDVDGFEQNNGIMIVGATNFPEVLDKALIRPGRFDR